MRFDAVLQNLVRKNLPARARVIGITKPLMRVGLRVTLFPFRSKHLLCFGKPRINIVIYMAHIPTFFTPSARNKVAVNWVCAFLRIIRRTEI